MARSRPAVAPFRRYCPGARHQQPVASDKPPRTDNLRISPARPRQWAFVDWDTAAPGSRLWDVAYALHGFVPLSANPYYQRGSPAHRMRLFADAYGLDQAQRQELLPMLARRTKAMHDFLAGQAATGAQPWTRLWQHGHGRTWRADTDYIAEREDTWRRALLD